MGTTLMDSTLPKFSDLLPTQLIEDLFLSPGSERDRDEKDRELERDSII